MSAPQQTPPASQAASDKATTFVPLGKIVEDFVNHDRKTFISGHPDPVILFDELGAPSGPEAGFQTLTKQVRDTPADSPKSAREKILSRLEGGQRVVCPLRRQSDKFASMITVGRAANNVLRLNVASVSKFHAYITHVARENCWYIADANSSNGTFIDGNELPPSHGKVPLKSGSTLRFGPDCTGQFFTADGLWELLHGALGESGEFRTLPLEPPPPGGATP